MQFSDITPRQYLCRLQLRYEKFIISAGDVTDTYICVRLGDLRFYFCYGILLGCEDFSTNTILCMENDIYNYINYIYDCAIIRNSRSIINGYELDIALHQEIIKRAVTLALEVMQSERVKTQPVIDK